MSSNAFARSRPRVRHQRVPRTHSCDHPRFIQLVNELARLNEIKKKQEESEEKKYCSSTDDDSVPTASNDNSANLMSIKNCNSSNNSGNSSTSSSISSSASNNNSNCTNVIGPGGSTSSASLNNNSGLHLNNLGACCNQIGTNPPQTSNGYRSLDSSSQSTSALHDNYLHHHHQHQQQNQHHPHQHHQLHHNQHHHYNHHHQLQQQQLLIHEPQHLVQQQSDDHCVGKNSTTNFGYTKHNLVVEQNTSVSDYSINNVNNNIIDSNSDLRQDENRSKRKRPSNDSTVNSRKNLSSLCGSTNSNKRHKSGSEAIRPLSPSFTKCPICLLDSMDRDPSFTNTCFHLFCYVCIENWTKNKATCPLCRTKFTKIIFNIKSATNYEEKIASPIRRDDDDNYIGERFIMEHLTGINNSNTSVSNRNANSDDVQFLFENLSRNSDVLMPQYFVNQIDPRQGEPLHSFNTVTTPTNFNSNVPHPPFTNTSYPMTPTNYIVGTLLPSNRIAPMTSTAITSAYTANTSLNNINTDSSFRRVSRSIRSMYSRTNYESPTVDSSGRVSRASNTTINQPGVQIERHHNNQHQHHHQSHQHHHHHPPANRTTLDMTPRHNQRLEQSHANQLPIPYTIQARQYNPPNVSYIRRPYNNPQLEYHHQHLDILYRHMPDM